LIKQVIIVSQEGKTVKPFRKHVALAVDGGGIKGVIVTRALAHLEEELGKPIRDIFHLSSGTSTGSIISAGLAAGLSATQMYQLYVDLGNTIFQKSWRTFLFPLSRYRYPHEPLTNALTRAVGNRTMGDIWNQTPQIDVVITAFDLVTNRTCFIKPWKDEYKSWPVVQAVLASSSVPTYFPIVAGRYVDGGVGSYANPCYLAAYEAVNCLNWDPAETTLISLGTGRDPHYLAPGQADSFFAWQWITPVLGAFLQSADDQQVHLVANMWPDLDFRRFNVDLLESITMDDPSKISELSNYGETMWQKIKNDETDPIPSMRLAAGPGRKTVPPPDH
jgi:hypothetical protein